MIRPALEEETIDTKAYFFPLEEREGSSFFSGTSLILCRSVRFWALFNSSASAGGPFSPQFVSFLISLTSTVVVW